jgi:hypothetical protein
MTGQIERSNCNRSIAIIRDFRITQPEMIMDVLLHFVAFDALESGWKSARFL